jgi:hypothetical protein
LEQKELDDDCTLSYDIGDSPVYTEMSLLKKTSPLASNKQISAVTAVKNTFQSAVTSTALPPKPPPAAKKPPPPAAPQVAKASSTSLPPGWQELTCEESGQQYFYNEAKAISSWDRPSAPAPPPAAMKPPPTFPSLPQEWKEVFDSVSGRMYYFNEVTRITQWHLPQIDDSW